LGHLGQHEQLDLVAGRGPMRGQRELVIEQVISGADTPERGWYFLVDTVVTAIDTNKTSVTIRQHYATRSLKAKFANLLARRKIASQTADTLRAIKRGIERDWTMSKS
jgi:hypothetical protein